MSFADVYNGSSHSTQWPDVSRASAQYESQYSDQTHIALQRFAEFANEDVEMQAPISESAAFLVVDTNILLHYLDVLVQFVGDVERRDLPVIVIIPSAVVKELDGQKKGNNEISWFSRKASSWLLQKVQERKVVKGQARGNVHSIEQYDHHYENDDKIIDCAMYFARQRRTFMCSADKILCFKCSNEDSTIGLINPADYTQWSSYQLASLIFGDSSAISDFKRFTKTYKEGSNIIEEKERTDDSMDVDDSFDDSIFRRDAITSLHIQVIEHFTDLLTDLVSSDQRERAQTQVQVTADGVSASMHAPYLSLSSHAPNHLQASEMTLSEILTYLDDAPSGRLNLRRNNPTLDAFLSRPYTHRSGGRLGKEWSKEDWLICLRKLEKVGKAWNGKGQGQAIIDSLKLGLEPHLGIVFAQAMTI